MLRILAYPCVNLDDVPRWNFRVKWNGKRIDKEIGIMSMSARSAQRTLGGVGEWVGIEPVGKIETEG